MRRRPSFASSGFAPASILMALGAPTAACSGDLAPIAYASDSSTDQNASESSVDAGVPDVATDDQSLPGVAYGPLVCNSDSDCAPGRHCDLTTHSCEPSPIVSPDAQDAPPDQDPSDAGVDGETLDTSIDRAAVDASTDRESADATSGRDATGIDDGSPDGETTYDAGPVYFYGPVPCYRKYCMEGGAEAGEMKEPDGGGDD